ncbi:MAG: hypothetical protein Q7J65_01045 [Candidatus Marinimicrobia bacterium]|nr:hypothetical protein [Candidatus Neomarinimicrobiota bacterium]
MKEKEKIIRENRFFKVLLIVVVAFSFISTSCDDVDENSDETFTLSGTVTKSGINDGVKAYMKLVSKGGGMTAEALYSTDATFSGGTATYTGTNIEEGEYILYAFIDMNGNAAGTESSAPDAGDYVTLTDVNMNSDKTLDAPENVWIVYQP